MRGKVILLAVSLLVLHASPSHATATVTYTYKPTFLSVVGTTITDTYDAPGYQSGVPTLSGGHILTDAAMSAVLGETTYKSTYLSNYNDVYHVSSSIPSNNVYCAGCNGSFQLGFSSTSISRANGVYGVGFNFINQSINQGPGYTAYVTFGDGSAQNYLLPDATQNGAGGLGGFFGIKSDLQITSIAFGGTDGATTGLGSFSIDNLTIGAAPTTIPLPASLPLFASGLCGLVLLHRRRRKKVAALTVA